MPPLHAASRQEDIISIWNKTASDQGTTARIRDTLRRVLNLPPNTIMEYKTHTDSIKYVCLLLFFIFFSSFPFSSAHSINLHAHTHFPTKEATREYTYMLPF